MRQILRLLCGGNKHNLCLILPSPFPLNQSPWAKGRRWLYEGFWGQYFPKAARLLLLHPSFCKTPTPGREMATGGDNLGSLQPQGLSKQQMRSSIACCWQTQQPKKAMSGLITPFPRVSQPDVCLLVVCKGWQENGQRGFRNYFCTFEGVLMSKRMGKGKSKDKSSKFILVGTWL